MANVVNYNTDRMRDWSEKVAKSGEEFIYDIRRLYQEVEDFVGSGFTGGLADEFYSSFEEKKSFFEDNKNVIDECTDYLAKHSNEIENDEQDLLARMKNSNYIER